MTQVVVLESFQTGNEPTTVGATVDIDASLAALMVTTGKARFVSPPSLTGDWPAASPDQLAAARIAFAAGQWAVFTAPVPGLVAGVETPALEFTADTSQRIIGLAAVFNASSARQAAEQIAAGQYSVYPLDSAEALTLMSPGPVIERVAVVALATTTFATGFCISPTETTVADILAALRFIVVQSEAAVALNLSSVPAYTAGVVSSAVASITFSEAA